MGHHARSVKRHPLPLCDLKTVLRWTRRKPWRSAVLSRNRQPVVPYVKRSAGQFLLPCTYAESRQRPIFIGDNCVDWVRARIRNGCDQIININQPVVFYPAVMNVWVV